ncbi:carboxylesterase [Hypoxylon fuscum]|nr:carboxylesterase [Hypoxylon fuscum]
MATIFLFGAIAMAGAALAEQNPVVSLHNGAVRGTVSDYVSGVNVFKGIRFADPATGEYRWTHPPHPTSWNETLDAFEFGNECAQMGQNGTITGSEDCLFLNIWTPENFSNSSNYPVYLWSYGGRFSGGSGSDPAYDGSALAAKGAVVVTYNYRLGVLGGLAHPELSAESEGNSTGNWFLQDQIACLHWTNENIQLFGGNPSQITLGGQSAGSGISLAMVYSPLAAGLFQGAIAESGARAPHDPLTGSLATSHRNKTEAEAQGVAFLKALNVSSIEEARQLPLATLLAASPQSDTIFVGTPFENNSAYMEPPVFRPVIDGFVLVDTYAGTLANHSQNDVPILTGNNRDESGASPDPRTMAVSDYNTSNNAIFEPIGLSEKYFELFPASTDAEAGTQTNNFYRNQSLVSGWTWASAWAAGGGNSSVYTYFWTHAPPGQSAGAFHGSEINYALGNIAFAPTLQGQTLNWTAQDYAIQETMSQYWYNFIATGNPNGGNLTAWEASSTESKTTMVLGDSYGTIPIASDDVLDLITSYFSTETAW